MRSSGGRPQTQRPKLLLRPLKRKHRLKAGVDSIDGIRWADGAFSEKKTRLLFQKNSGLAGLPFFARGKRRNYAQEKITRKKLGTNGQVNTYKRKNESKEWSEFKARM